MDNLETPAALGTIHRV